MGPINPPPLAHTQQSGFCKAFSDEPERFAQGLSPLKDMLINLNMNNVMLYPR